MKTRIAFFVVVGGIIAATLWLYVLVPSAHPRNADAIVVLSGDRDRLDTGLRLLQEHVASTLILSRDPAPWPRANRLCGRSDFICIHAHPYSTQGEAETVRRLARRHGWHRIVVVTSRYHLRRARVLFRRCLHSTPAFVAAPTTFWDYVENIPWEWAKLAYQLTFDRRC